MLPTLWFIKVDNRIDPLDNVEMDGQVLRATCFGVCQKWYGRRQFVTVYHGKRSPIDVISEMKDGLYRVDKEVVGSTINYVRFPEHEVTSTIHKALVSRELVGVYRVKTCETCNGTRTLHNPPFMPVSCPACSQELGNATCVAAKQAIDVTQAEAKKAEFKPWKFDPYDLLMLPGNRSYHCRVACLSNATTVTIQDEEILYSTKHMHKELCMIQDVGQYDLSQLPPGLYRVSTSKLGVVVHKYRSEP